MVPLGGFYLTLKLYDIFTLIILVMGERRVLASQGWFKNFSASDKIFQ
jgi:hypothetical protein